MFLCSCALDESSLIIERVMYYVPIIGYCFQYLVYVYLELFHTFQVRSRCFSGNNAKTKEAIVLLILYSMG